MGRENDSENQLVNRNLGFRKLGLAAAILWHSDAFGLCRPQEAKRIAPALRMASNRRNKAIAPYGLLRTASAIAIKVRSCGGLIE
jgi:hypothetical protein